MPRQRSAAGRHSHWDAEPRDATATVEDNEGERWIPMGGRDGGSWAFLCDSLACAPGGSAPPGKEGKMAGGVGNGIHTLFVGFWGISPTKEKLKAEMGRKRSEAEDNRRGRRGGAEEERLEIRD